MGGDEYSVGSVVQAAVALLQLSLYEQIHTGPSAPPTAVSHEPEREWNQEILIPLNGHTNNNPDVSHPVDAKQNPSPDQQEDQPENQDVNPPVESTEPNPKATADGLNASDQAEPNGGDEERVRKVKANDTTTDDEDENLFEGLEPLDWKIISDLNSPVDSTEPNPRAPVDGLNAGDQAEPNGGDEEGVRKVKANDTTTVDEDENQFEGLEPLDWKIIPDLNSPVDSTEPTPRAPVDGLNADDQAEPNGGDEEGFKKAEANDPTTVDEDENLFEELGPLDGRLFYLPAL